MPRAGPHPFVVMPAYNEGPDIEAAVMAWHDGVASRITDTELVVVDICSTEVPVQHFARTAGHQSMRGLLKWARTGVKCSRELLELRRSLSRER
jgi:hypothetical protein